MRGLGAALLKDLKIFQSGAGLVSLFLPLLLMIALGLGGGGLSQNIYVEPFAIAVRDEDQSFMSKTLIGQISGIELFSQVLTVREEETDSEILKKVWQQLLQYQRTFFIPCIQWITAL